MSEGNEFDHEVWPRSGDILFRPGGDGCTAWIPGRPEWGLYSEGYKRAADIVVDRLRETHRSADFLIYPIVFLYRHHLELSIKEVIASGRQLLGEADTFPTVHRFEDLWPVCRKVLEAIWPGSSPNDLDAVEECLRQFSTVDPQSMNFRYPLTRDGKATLPTQETIDVENIQSVVNRVSTLLECASMGISAYRGNQFIEELE